MKPDPYRKNRRDYREDDYVQPKAVKSLHVGKRCGPTGKVIFKTESGALNRAVQIFKEDSNRKAIPNQFRAYECERCGFYHLTGKKDYMIEATYVTR